MSEQMTLPVFTGAGATPGGTVMMLTPYPFPNIRRVLHRYAVCFWLAVALVRRNGYAGSPYHLEAYRHLSAKVYRVLHDAGYSASQSVRLWQAIVGRTEQAA